MAPKRKIQESQNKVDIPNELWLNILSYVGGVQQEKERMFPIYYDKPLLSKQQWIAIYYQYLANYNRFHK